MAGILGSLGESVMGLQMFPLFDLAHASLSCLALREELGVSALKFSRKHPLALYVSSMFEILAGGIISSFLLGEPVASALNSNNHLLLYSFVHYMIFYAPLDSGYELAKSMPFKIPASLLKEIFRVKKVHDGVAHALELYPTGYAIAIVIGTIKGNGSGFGKIFSRLVRGTWNAKGMEVLAPSFGSKSALCAAILFIVGRVWGNFPLATPSLYLLVIAIFIHYKLAFILQGPFDPFAPIEGFCCAICFGSTAPPPTKRKATKSATTNTEKEEKTD